ncbi:MAG: YidC/Oxa1 family membrane protein insertase [Candidatus Levybacteria bacterium]|nr:YidC/Oxa1 family membrane protein insertase [Candidatus Levybacteria bacterium]
MGDLFNHILIYPIINVLVAVYQSLTFFHVPYALGFAIIGLTVVVRAVLYPLMASQLKAAKKMQDLQPHLTTLKEKHKGDSKRLQEAQMALYKEHGVNPLAGCLPLLIQLPLLIALYNVLAHVVALPPQEALSYINGIVYFSALKLTTVWNTNFFGLPLGAHPSQLFATMPLILLVPLITAVLQFIQSKMMMTTSNVAEAAPLKQAGKKNKNKKALATVEPKKEDAAADFAKTFQTQSLYIFPIMLGYLSFSFPIGLSLYWNTFTLFGILQQYQISGWGTMQPWIDKLNLGVRGKRQG